MWPWPRPFEGWFIIGRWDLAGQHIWSTSDNLYTKFEVFRCTHCEDMKGGAKCRKLGGLGLLGVTQGHGYCHHPAERIRLLKETTHLSCIVFKTQWAICRRSQMLTYPTCIWHPHWGWPCSNFVIFSIRKLEYLFYHVVLFVPFY